MEQNLPCGAAFICLQQVVVRALTLLLVFDLETSLDDVAEAYAAMDERRAIKSLLTISQP